MGKYDPLKVFLQAQFGDQVPMTFSEIENVLGTKLPASKANRAWWSNNSDNNVMTKEWLGAGFETESVDPTGEKLVFRRVRPMEGDMSQQGFSEAPQAQIGAPPRPLHPGFGFLKGLITFADDFDPTEPAFPDWDEYEERKYGKDSKLHE